MDIGKAIKCFSEEHEETEAVCFCPECRIYMCKNCVNNHSSFFTNHHIYDINQNDDSEIFTGYCKEKNHTTKLDYFCKTHNQLCCGLCITKLKEIGNGQHKDCDVCIIQNIKDEKKNKLQENLTNLENLQNNFDDSMKKLKLIFQAIKKNKEQMKSDIRDIFIIIKNTIEERERELLLEIDNYFNSKYFDEGIIKKVEKLPEQIILSIKKGHAIDKEWDDDNLRSYINECIKIENTINNINIINDNINKFNENHEIKIDFSPKDNQFDIFLDTIKQFGKINYTIYQANKYSFRDCPINIIENKKYILTGFHKNILTKIGADGVWMGTICKYALDQSIEEHKWKIKILKSQKKRIMVGVAPSDFDINSSNYNTCGWYLYCEYTPKRLYSGPPFKYFSVETNLGEMNDEIVVVMNMKNRALKFIINNEDKGDSYTNIPLNKPIFPAIFLYSYGDSVEITEFN